MDKNRNFSGKITISYPWDLGEKISGPAVMFDVNAASHNIAYLTTITEALYVVDKYNVWKALGIIPDAVLVGESSDRTLQEKFHTSNNASEVKKAELKGKKVILITNNGTHTLNELWEKGADPIIVCDYANLHTVSEWILKNCKREESITLVPAGGREEQYAKDPDLLEDLLCAQALEKLLRGGKPDFKSIFTKSREYIDATNPQYWPTKEDDLDLIFTEKDLYKVVPICVRDKNRFLEIRNIQ